MQHLERDRHRRSRGRLTPFWGLQLRSAVAAISTAWVVYATGWGSLLVIAYAIAIADAMRVHGSRAWRPGLVWSMVAVFGGEVAVELGLAPSIMQPSTSHALAGATTCCLALIVRTLGVSAKAAEDAAVRIEEGRSYFRDLVQHAADVIALVSENLRIEYVSPGIESMVGCTAAACIGLHIRDVLGTDASADIARAHETLTLSDYVSCEWRLTNELRGQRQVYAAPDAAARQVARPQSARRDRAARAGGPAPTPRERRPAHQLAEPRRVDPNSSVSANAST